MNYNFFIIGGDKRNLLLAKRLSKNGENVKIFGFNRIKDSFFANNNIKKIANEKFLISELKNMEKKGNKKIIIGPIPYSIDGKTLYAPFNDENININLLKNEKIIAGKIPSEIADKESIDILKDECFTIKNTVPTAEGAIAKAIELTDINIFRANVMVLGFGRVGKTLCYKLKSLGANVYAEARNEKDLAWIDVLGYKAIPLEKINENLCKMNIIFNTIPKLILDKSKLILINESTVIIDLASKPGGIDYESANKMGINTILYTGIPGKIAGEYEAELIEELIYKKITNITN
jgi:dipicolinate synthase subunit A